MRERERARESKRGKESVPRDTYAGAAQSLHDSQEKVDREEDRKNRMKKREKERTHRKNRGTDQGEKEEERAERQP